MRFRSRLTLFVLTAFTVLAVSAVTTVPAFADDGSPPPQTDTPLEPEGTTETAPAGQEAPPPQESTGEPIPVEETAPSDTPPLDETSTPAEVLAQVPQGTDVVILDENGESVPLATQEAADAIEFIDPVWCPTGVAPKTDGTGGCTTSYGSLKLLIDALMTGTAGVVPNANGVIWIAAGADASLGAILLNGTDSDLGNWENFSLTLQGGWNGTSGSTTVNPLTPSTFSKTISITNWLGDVTLNNITSSVPSGTGLTVTTTKNINLVNVSSTSASGSGASLDNSAGTGNVTVTSSKFNSSSVNGLAITSKGTITLASLQANSNTTGYGAFLVNTSGTGNITLSSSTFNANGLWGLVGNSAGTITLSNLQVNGNTGSFGASFDNATAALPKNVVMTGANEFNSNKNTGLTIYSDGSVSLNDVTASENGLTSSGYGALIDNSGGPNPGLAVTLTGTNVFNHNNNVGLYVYSKGVITANNLIANSNIVSYGAQLNNGTASTAQAVNLTGSSQFKYDGGDGLNIVSKGAVTLNNITATQSGESGAVINNTLGSAGVTLTGVNTFNQNDKWGLNIASRGAITASNLTAYQNGTDAGIQPGVYLDNQTSVGNQSVTLSGTNSFTYNTDGGLVITSNGAIVLSNVTATNSSSNRGVDLNNTYSTNLIPKPVTISGTNVFSNNYNYGLSINSYGAVTVNNITAETNGAGANVGGVSINNSGASAATPAAVTLSGVNKFLYNFNTGLSVQSIGAITLSNVTAQSNGSGPWGSGVGMGANLNNSGGTNAGVTLSGINAFNYNYSTGLYVLSKGAIVLNSVTAVTNGVGAGAGDGAYLDNSSAGAGSARKVTLTGVNVFSSNYRHGLYVLATGAVSLNSVKADNNGSGDPSGHGVKIINTHSGTASLQAVTLTGTNSFGSNNSAGLEIATYGAVTLSNLTATSNGFSDPTRREGVYIDNASGAITPAAVTISGINTFTSNKSTGLKIISLGAITLSTVTANYNGSGVAADGANLNNSASTSGAGVTLTGTNVFSNNNTNGLVIDSKGAISTNNLTASNNANGYGAMLDNCLDSGFGCTTAPKAVSVSGVNSFGYNYYSGIEIYSSGAVTVNSITATQNGMSGGLNGYGLKIDNNNPLELGGFSVGNVTLSGTNSLTYSYYDGLSIASNGAILVNNLTASNNGTPAGYYGASFTNSTASTAQNVTLTGTNVFNTNKSGGILGLSKGVITLNNITAMSNGVGVVGIGVNLDNTASTTSAGVTLTGTNVFSNNYTSGLQITSTGAISLNNVTASSNANGYGVYLSNLYAGSPKSVTLNGVNRFENNYSSGLEIYSKGAVTVNSITATSNGTSGGTYGYGLKIDNDDAGAVGNVTLSGTNFLTYNYYDGLNVASNGAILINNLTASNNGTPTGYYGATLTNNFTSAVQNVTLTGTNVFNSNKSGGLLVYSNGVITLNNVTAVYNGAGGGGNGAYLDNTSSTSGAGVTLTGTNVFSNNQASGLYITSKGAISTNNLTASSNANGYGAVLNNCYDLGSGCTSAPKAVSLSGVNSFAYNYYGGLEIYSMGAVTVNSITAYYNGMSGGTYGYGLYIDNDAAGAVGNVTLSGTNSLTYNYFDGLNVQSKGAISLNSVTASNNGVPTNFYGAFLNNSSATTAKNVSLTGTNVFNSNKSGGLRVVSLGAITSSLALTASFNNGNDGGINLYNAGASTAQPVTLSGIVSVPSNHGAGLTVSSKGAITVSNLTATSNGFSLGGSGAWLDNTFGSVPSVVTLLGTNLTQYNLGEGLHIDATGAISINNLTSSSNGSLAFPGSGADLSNWVLGTGAVTFTGVNTFEYNYTSGLEVQSTGAISLNSVTASSNANGKGVWLSNITSAQPNITLSGTNTFYGNNQTGLLISTYGTVTLNNLTATSNGYSGTGDGVSITNTGGTLAKNVTLTGTNTFNANNDIGLVVSSYGSISISNLTASGNGSTGAVLDNDFSFVSPVTISGFGTFNNNVPGSGLVIESFGAVTLANLTAKDNGFKGVDIDNHLAAGPQAVTITGVNTFFSNGSDGLLIESKGAISLNNVTANENGGYGAYLRNEYSGTPGITLSGVNNFLNSGFNGLYILSNGNVSAAKVTADGNAGGMFVTTAGNVTLTCGNFANNGAYGLRVAGGGGVSLLKLIGVFSSGSTVNINTSLWTGLFPTPIRNCP